MYSTEFSHGFDVKGTKKAVQPAKASQTAEFKVSKPDD